MKKKKLKKSRRKGMRRKRMTMRILHDLLPRSIRVPRFRDEKVETVPVLEPDEVAKQKEESEVNQNYGMSLHPLLLPVVVNQRNLSTNQPKRKR